MVRLLRNPGSAGRAGVRLVAYPIYHFSATLLILLTLFQAVCELGIRYAEALVVAAHAIIKERIYTLNDYFTTQKWTT